MWHIFKKYILIFVLVLSYCSISTSTFAQYAMSDSTHMVKIDSVKLNDSIRKYTLAHIDTTFKDFNKSFHPIPFFHQLPIQQIQIQTPQINYKFSWFMVVLLFCIIIVTFAKLYYQNYFSILFNYVYSFHIYTTTRDLGALNNLGTFLLNIVYLLCVSMSLYFITIFFYPSIQDKFSLYFIILIIFTSHYLLKIIILYFMENFMKNKIALDQYIKSISQPIR